MGGRCSTKSNYESIIISPPQALAIWSKLPLAESTLTMLAASTGLRISECLGLQWGISNSQLRSFGFGAAGLVERSGSQKRKRQRVRFRVAQSLWLVCRVGGRRVHIPKTQTGYFRASAKRASNPALAKCWSRIISGPLHLSWGYCEKARKRDSVFMPCATAWLYSWSARVRTQRWCRRRYDTLT